ncbi:hypothetical protein Angca_004333, partial [Angiostrongylus cantonensis]
TIRDHVEQLGVRIRNVLEHLKKSRRLTKLNKWMSDELNNSKKYGHFKTLPSVLLRNNNYPFLGRIATCDEK